MDRSMWVAAIVVFCLFSGIIIYTLEFGHLSNYISWGPLLRWSLYIGLPLSLCIAWLFHRSNAWVKPMVYRMMAFLAFTVLIFTPLLIHLINTEFPSGSQTRIEVSIASVNGHQMRRFGVLEDEEKQQFDYYILLLESDIGYFKYRIDHWPKELDKEPLILIVNSGFLGIPYLRLSYGQ